MKQLIPALLSFVLSATAFGLPSQEEPEKVTCDALVNPLAAEVGNLFRPQSPQSAREFLNIYNPKRLQNITLVYNASEAFRQQATPQEDEYKKGIPSHSALARMVISAVLPQLEQFSGLNPTPKHINELFSILDFFNTDSLTNEATWPYTEAFLQATAAVASERFQSDSDYQLAIRFRSLKSEANRSPQISALMTSLNAHRPEKSLTQVLTEFKAKQTPARKTVKIFTPPTAEQALPDGLEPVISESQPVAPQPQPVEIEPEPATIQPEPIAADTNQPPKEVSPIRDEASPTEEVFPAADLDIPDLKSTVSPEQPQIKATEDITDRTPEPPQRRESFWGRTNIGAALYTLRTMVRVYRSSGN